MWLTLPVSCIQGVIGGLCQCSPKASKKGLVWEVWFSQSGIVCVTRSYREDHISFTSSVDVPPIEARFLQVQTLPGFSWPSLSLAATAASASRFSAADISWHWYVMRSRAADIPRQWLCCSAMGSVECGRPCILAPSWWRYVSWMLIVAMLNAAMTATKNQLGSPERWLVAWQRWLLKAGVKLWVFSSFQSDLRCIAPLPPSHWVILDACCRSRLAMFIWEWQDCTDEVVGIDFCWAILTMAPWGLWGGWALLAWRRLLVSHVWGLFRVWMSEDHAAQMFMLQITYPMQFIKRAYGLMKLPHAQGIPHTQNARKSSNRISKWHADLLIGCMRIGRSAVKSWNQTRGETHPLRAFRSGVVHCFESFPKGRSELRIVTEILYYAAMLHTPFDK